MTETEFVAAVLDPSRPVPGFLVRPDGHPPTKRFAVYRNNVAVGLTDTLQTDFPVVRKLVGEAFFDAMAGEFLRRHPPQSRIMMLYGDAFADFLARFPPVANLGYLPDVARLDQALRESYHTADADPIATGITGDIARGDVAPFASALRPRVATDPLSMADPCDLAGQYLRRTSSPTAG